LFRINKQLKNYLRDLTLFLKLYGRAKICILPKEMMEMNGEEGSEDEENSPRHEPKSLRNFNLKLGAIIFNS